MPIPVLAGSPVDDDRQNVWVVIPAFNEASVIGSVVTELRTAGWSVAVVNDGSKDDTAEQARICGATVVSHRINRGQGAALATGIRFAVERAADVVVTFDADGQHQVADIARLVSVVQSGRADAVLGSRFAGTALNIPYRRRLLLRAAALFTRIMSGVRVTDAHNGLRALRADVAGRLRLKQDRMAHASELVDELGRCGARIEEVPVQIRYTPYSLAKGQRTRHALGVLVDYLLG